MNTNWLAFVDVDAQRVLLISNNAHDDMHWAAVGPDEERSAGRVRVWSDPEGRPVVVEASGADPRSLEAEICEVLGVKGLLLGSPTLDVMRLPGWVWWDTQLENAASDEGFTEVVEQADRNRRRIR